MKLKFIQPILISTLATQISAQSSLLHTDDQQVINSGYFNLHSNDNGGSISTGYFGVFSQDSRSVLMYDIGLASAWTGGFDGSVGAIDAGIIRRSRLKNGAVLGFNAYLDIGTLNGKPAGLFSLGAEYQPATTGALDLTLGGNLYQAFEDYTDTEKFGAAGAVPRNGLDVFATAHYDLGEDWDLTGTFGMFGYSDTNSAKDLRGASLDVGAQFAFGNNSYLTGSIGLRNEDGRESDVVAKLGVQIALGRPANYNSAAITTDPDFSDKFYTPTQTVPAVHGTTVVRPTRHFGFGTPFTPVRTSIVATPTSPTDPTPPPPAPAMVACQVEIILNGTGSPTSEQCAINGNGGIPLGTSVDVADGSTVLIESPDYTYPGSQVAEVNSFICVDRNNGNANVPVTVVAETQIAVSNNPIFRDISLVVASQMDVLCTVTFEHTGL